MQQCILLLLLQCLPLKENLHKFSSLSLLQAASTHSLISLTICFLLLLLRVDLSYFLFLSCALFCVFLFYVFLSEFRSGICFTGMQCWASLFHSFLSSSNISATLCQSLLLLSPSCVLLFMTMIVFYNYLVFSCHFHYTIV